ncbi:hypothetical protein L1887_00135 [Cichorium endivia]|nr:hypothetical protein L1887_00135 [Cichorium endivia]
MIKYSVETPGLRLIRTSTWQPVHKHIPKITNPRHIIKLLLIFLHPIRKITLLGIQEVNTGLELETNDDISAAMAHNHHQRTADSQGGVGVKVCLSPSRSFPSPQINHPTAATNRQQPSPN